MQSRLIFLSCSCLLVSVVEASPLHCVGTQGANCEATGCQGEEMRVDLTLEPRARRAEVCIGESCYTGSLRLAAGSALLEGDFAGQDPRKEGFMAHVTLNAKEDAATLTWSDGTLVAMAFAKCGRTKAE